MWVQSLGQEDPLEKEMATQSSTLTRRILWTEEPGTILAMGLKESNRTKWLNKNNNNSLLSANKNPERCSRDNQNTTLKWGKRKVNQLRTLGRAGWTAGTQDILQASLPQNVAKSQNFLMEKTRQDGLSRFSPPTDQVWGLPAVPSEPGWEN